MIEEAARKVLLPPAEVKMWFNHLASVATIRKNAGKKAAQTRKQKAKEKSATLQYSCGVCHDVYKEYTSKVENWICCDGCDTWYHFVCVGVSEESIPEQYFCDSCC